MFALPGASVHGEGVMQQVLLSSNLNTSLIVDMDGLPQKRNFKCCGW